LWESASGSIELFKMTNSNINCNFELHMDKDIYYKGVESKLTRVVINILNNSYESFNKNNIENKKIAILLKNIDGFINIKITDNAGGIEPSIINKIFDPYFTTKHQYQDTGLGLFICLRIIVDNFDGNIICKNIDIKSEKGCEFLITIPVQVS
jgi:signal transduction histidine kinase